MTFAAGTHVLVIDGPCGLLEASLTVVAEQRGIALVCHPHPLHDGTMNNKVVTTAAKAFVKQGITTLRFNFRGVGASLGSYADGAGEQEDALAAVAWLQKTYPQQPLWLAGFSFGSYVTAAIATRVAPTGLILIAPPVTNFPFQSLTAFPCTTSVLMGTNDEVVDFGAVLTWYNNVTSTVDLRRFEGVSHFFHGHLLDLRDTIEELCQDL